jgi:hypothetical protein
MMTKSLGGYEVLVNANDPDCLMLQATERWPSDEFDDSETPSAKSMAEIIVNAANYATAPAGYNPGGYHYYFLYRPLIVEPRHPKPNLNFRP